jgi:hypothetical protein
LPETLKVCVILLKNADISVFVVQEYLDLGLPQLDTPPASQELTWDEEAFPFPLTSCSSKGDEDGTCGEVSISSDT